MFLTSCTLPPVPVAELITRRWIRCRLSFRKRVDIHSTDSVGGSVHAHDDIADQREDSVVEHEILNRLTARKRQALKRFVLTSMFVTIEGMRYDPTSPIDADNSELAPTFSRSHGSIRHPTGFDSPTRREIAEQTCETIVGNLRLRPRSIQRNLGSLTARKYCS